MEQAFGIYLLGAKHRLIRRLKRVYEPSVHGHKTWTSSFLLMDYLQHHPLTKGASVMEIGCGWGPASVFCAKRFGAKVTGVDIDKDVFPFLEVMAELNGVEVEPLKSRFEDLTAKQLGQHDVLVGSDICFWDNLVEPLFKLTKRALKGGTRRIIIADPGRPPFYEFCDRAAKKFKVSLNEWYATEPNRFTGEIIEIQAKSKSRSSTKSKRKS